MIVYLNVNKITVCSIGALYFVDQLRLSIFNSRQQCLSNFTNFIKKIYICINVFKLYHVIVPNFTNFTLRYTKIEIFIPRNCLYFFILMIVDFRSSFNKCNSIVVIAY